MFDDNDNQGIQTATLDGAEMDNMRGGVRKDNNVIWECRRPG
jgi:hypothetical protein